MKQGLQAGQIGGYGRTVVVTPLGRMSVASLVHQAPLPVTFLLIRMVPCSEQVADFVGYQRDGVLRVVRVVGDQNGLTGGRTVAVESVGLLTGKDDQDAPAVSFHLAVRMPRIGGLEATRLIKAEQPDVRVVMLTVSDDEDDLFEALKAGAQGYLLKNLKSDVFFEFIEGAARGEAPIAPSMAAKMLGEFGREPVRKAAGGMASLSERELEVLELVAQARNNREIAEALFITERTVKFHTRNIIDKLHLKNRAQVIAYASRKGYGVKGTEEQI